MYSAILLLRTVDISLTQIFTKDRMSLVSHWFLSSSVRVSPVVVDVVIDVAASVAFRYAAVVSVFTFDHAV